MKKRELRQILLKKRSSLSPRARKEKSEQIREKLFSLHPFLEAKTVMFYLSLPTEVSTDKMIQESLEKGKVVVVPCIEEDEIRPAYLESLKEVEIRSLGIREPLKKRFVPQELLDLIVVPGCGFDERGYRIGLGKGFYDRFLSTLKGKIPLVGLAFECQVVKKLPFEEWDVRMDWIITERRIIKT